MEVKLKQTIDILREELKEPLYDLFYDNFIYENQHTKTAYQGNLNNKFSNLVEKEKNKIC